MSTYFITFAIVIVIVAFVIASFFISKNLKKKRLSKALGLRLLLIRLPQKTSKEFPTETRAAEAWKDEINLSSQLFSILAGLKSPFGLEAAVHHIGEEIYFYAAVPKESMEFVSRQIEGLWKEAKVEQIDDYNIFNPNGVNQGVYLKQKLSYALPIRTYSEANLDTFAPILSGLSKINEVGEGAAIQILVKPAPASTKKTISQMIENLKRGEKFEDILKGGLIKLKDVKKAIRPEEKEKTEKIIDEEAIKTLDSKINKPLLSVNLRVLVSASSQYQADTILESIAGRFSQFSAPLRNEIKIIKSKNPQSLIYQFSFREFDESQSMVLNTEELASVFHLPASSTAIPKIKWLKSKEAAPPANLPTKGILIGESFFRRAETGLYYRR